MSECVKGKDPETMAVSRVSSLQQRQTGGWVRERVTKHYFIFM